MKEELNIAAILNEKPTETKLWSPISGDCKYEYLIHDSINVWFQGLGVIMLSKKGKWNPCGETIIFPSKQMQDWSKFAWKKGDVLVSNDGKREVLFKTWERDSYTKFVGLHCLIINDNEEVEYDNGTTVFNTNDFKGIEAEDVAQTYINTIEERFGGKLNLETLEIEEYPEFKDGDILYSNLVGNEVFIVKIEEKCILHSYVYMDIYNKVLNIDKDETFSISGCIYDGNIRLATDSEKQQLFSALAKEGKRWNPDTKQIEDLPKKCEFKPMDWCLMRDKKETWKLCQFSFFDDGDYEAPYNAVGGNWFDECIPYNDQTKHLLGTTDK
jgi:hypothetical protein